MESEVGATSVVVTSIQGDMEGDYGKKREVAERDERFVVEDQSVPLAPAKRALPWLPWHATGLCREMLSEFWGTFILIMLGDGVCANSSLGNGLLNTSCPAGKACDAEPAGGFTNINLAWGLAVTMGVFSSQKFSGAHLNPAVTFSLAIFKGFSWKKVIPYWFAQCLGGFVAAAVIYSVYWQSFHHYDPDLTLSTAGVFATYPKPWISNGGAFWDEVVGTALLMAGIIAIGDGRNVGLTGQEAPWAVGALVMVIGMSYGIQSGYAINPARDFGPRLFTLCGGWGTETFSTRDCYFWVPVIGPLVGGPLGTFLYMLFVEQHHDLD